MNKLPGNEVILPNVRLSYPQIFKMKQETNKDGSPKGDPKFQASFILDKVKHAGTIKKIHAAIAVARKAKFGTKTVHLTHKGLRDGIEKDSDGYGEGTMFIGCHNYNRIQLVGHNTSVPITAEDSILYGGCYVNAHIKIKCYDFENVKGVTTTVSSIQFVRDGEPFGEASTPADEVFSNIEDADEPDPMD